MSRVDESGVRHPTANDPLDIYAGVHLAYCRVCNPYALHITRLHDTQLAKLARWLQYRNTSVLSESEIRDAIVSAGF